MVSVSFKLDNFSCWLQNWKKAVKLETFSPEIWIDEELRGKAKSYLSYLAKRQNLLNILIMNSGLFSRIID